jgi:replicative DNA helicase
MFLYRPDYYKITEDEDGNSVVNMMEVIVAKNNTDKTFSTYLWVNENFTTFSDIQSNQVVFNFPIDRLNELNFDI